MSNEAEATTTGEAPTGAVKFIESWRPRWTDLVLVAMAVGLWVAGGLIERYTAVVLLLWPLARTLRNRYATMVSPTGISWQVRNHPYDLPWSTIERLIAVEGLIARQVFLVQRGGKPTPLPTPIGFRLTSPRKFGLAVAELQRWAAAYGGQLRVETARTYPTWATVSAEVISRGVPFAAIVYDLVRRYDGRPLSDRATLTLFLLTVAVVPFLVGVSARRLPA